MRFPFRTHRSFSFALLFCCAGLLAFGLTRLSWRADAAAQGNSGGQSSPDGIWQGSGTTRAEGVTGQTRTFQLNQPALATVLNRAPREYSASLSASSAVITLPLPDGTFGRFQIEDSPAMEPALAAKFPEIKSYRGVGLDDRTATMRCDLSPAGFNALVLSAAGAFNVRPISLQDKTTYLVVAADDQVGQAQCSVNTANLDSAARPSGPAVAIGPTRKNYRMAIATTGEYTLNYGPDVPTALASVNTWINGVNVVFERDIGAHFNLVANNNIIIFTNAGTDGLTNSNEGTMLNEIVPILDAQIGNANYDIGHALGLHSTPGSSGGVASLASVCSGSLKGRGATRVSGAAGNGSALGVLTHEFGHQFNANHSFNGTVSFCNQKNNATSWEAGGGSTLMAYTGICAADNITSTRDLRFHSGSYGEAQTWLAGGTGGSCGAPVATGNTAPTINSGGNFTIPQRTPFTLTAVGNDADPTDVPNLTYTWEQLNVGGATFPQNGTAASYNDGADPNTTTRPIFRAFPPTASPARTFPSLTYILNNSNVPPDTVNGFQTAEQLPRVNRTLNFRVTVRDNRGGVNEADAVLTVAPASGPFAVTSPNGGNAVMGGVGTNVTWDVAGTSGAPISTANVKISLSTDGGNTFPTVLAASTPNDGTQTVTFPNGLISTTARVKVEAIGNIFFDISNANFSISPGDGCPAVSGINPAIINTGGQVVLTGTNFTGVTAVNFTGANVNCPSANCTVNNNTQITLTVPAGATTGPLTIVKGGCTSLQTTLLLIVCPNAPVTLTYDGGFGGSCNGVGSNGYYVVRVTPAAYPATLSNVLIEFDSFQGIAQGTAFTVVAAPHASGSTNINGVSFQTVNTIVGTLGALTSYAITPVTINSGDFVVGFSFPTNACAGLNDTTPTANRSYSSNDGGATFSAFAGDLLVRAQIFTGNCAGGGGNTAPTFTPAGALARQQGSPAGAAVQVGTVVDAQTAAGSLTVTQIAGGTATGITVTGITNTNGIITALVSAGCMATSGTVRFQVSDGSLTGTGDLTVNVTANSGPVFGYGSPQGVTSGGAIVVSPNAGPSDNGNVVSIVLQSQGTYTGTISVNNTSGVVSISNAGPVGSHTIVVRAADNCGAFTDGTFTLNVTAGNTAPTFTPFVALNRQQGSPAGAAVQVGTVADAQTAAGSLTVTQIAGGTATGITVSGVTNTNGTVTALVSAGCTATTGTVRFQVSDGSLTGTGDLTVNVTANTQPTLTYNNANVSVGGATTVNPATGLSDNGTVNTIVVQSQGTYTGTISVSAAGVVSISNAMPAGTHTITIRATDNCNATRDASFTLTVTSDPCQTFLPIAYGQTLNGVLQAGDCTTIFEDGSFSDLYSFNGTAGDQISIALNSGAFDAYLELRTAAGTVLANNNNGGGGTNARIPATNGFFTLPATGAYRIVANTFVAGGSGAYALTLSVSGGCITSVTVNNTGDAADATPGNGVCETAAANGVCTLRAAIQEANALPTCTPFTINFSVNGIFNLGTALPNLDHPNLTINGPGADLATVRRNAASLFRVFTNNATRTASLIGLTISNGDVGGGDTGGGVKNFGIMAITNCAITGNHANGAGGLMNEGTLTMTGSTISGNSANFDGGGLYNLGNTMATLTNCTISGNTGGAGSNGGLMIVAGAGQTATTTLTNCTVTANTGNNALGSFNSGGAIAITTQLRNTLVAGNTGANFSIGANTTLTSLGNTLDSDGTSGFVNGINGNIVGTPGNPINALLGTLANNGGPTQTHALLPGSPAINSGTNTGAPATDQRGIARPQQTTTDIGAYESRGFTLAILSGNNQTTTINTLFANALIVSVNSANGEPVNGGRVTFSPPGTGPSCTLTNNPATITGGQASVMATANGTAGTYNVGANASGLGGDFFTLTNNGVDGIVPTATVSAANISTGGATTYTFTITYNDNVAINVATLGNSDVNISGPGGFNGAATFVSVNNNSNGTPRTATYSIMPPGGIWDITDNGTYNVNMNTSQVADTAGNFVAASALGTFAVTINPGGNGLQFYPLTSPVRLLDTRPGASPNACSQTNAPIFGQTSRTQPGRNLCTIPANAQALTGNITTVNSGGGFLTLYASDAPQPTVASTNYGVNEIINNVFTVGLGADGAFKIFANNTTDVVVDVTGYYALPGTGGLYFHPLPAPVRLLETRAGLPVGCVKPGVPLTGNTESTQQAISACTGIPAAALAIVGNATTVGPQGGGFLTIFPADASRPLVAASNYNTGQVVNGPFAAGLAANGQFKIYTTSTTDLVVDVLGYFSPEANDTHGAGLLFTPLAHPIRLLETRPGLPVGCFKPGAPLAGGAETLQTARGLCDDVTIPANALGVVGNATVVFPSGAGFLTLWPSTALRPTVATSNYNAGDVDNRHFIVGLGNGDGAFKIYTHATSHLVIDLSGYFAP